MDDVDRMHIRVQALKQPGVPVEKGLWQWPEISEHRRSAVREYWDAIQRDDSPAYEVTFWGKRAFLEPVSLAIAEVQPEGDGVGWLQVLLDLIEQQGLQWREHIDPASGYPFSPHKDGMPPVPLSELRATNPDQLLGHSPFSDRSNLSLAFRATPEVGILLEVVAERVPGVVDANIELVKDGTMHEWHFHRGKVDRSSSRALGS